MAERSRYTAKDYVVGWICALAVELAASAAMFDEEHDNAMLDSDDDNFYAFGRMAGHNVVIACLESGRIGLVSAAHVAVAMKSTFRMLRFGLMVGIGAGVPSNEHDIRLGDVVVSRPFGKFNGVVQYDMGKTTTGNQVVRTGAMNSPPRVLLTATTAMEADSFKDRLKVPEYLKQIGTEFPKFAFPANVEDSLYEPDSIHVGGPTCKNCKAGLIEREERNNTNVVIHYGTIASGNQVMKNGVTRDQLSQELGIILCFEMEAAGLMNTFPCTVVRGICDYADSHKNKKWQPYAAAAAAAVAKELLRHVRPAEIKEAKTINHIMNDVIPTLTRAMATAESLRQDERDEKALEWLSDINFSAAQNTVYTSRTAGTGEWLFVDQNYIAWRDSHRGLLWLYGPAGCGKSVLTSAIVNDLKRICALDDTKIVAYWYFQFSNTATHDLSQMIRCLLRQLSSTPLSSAILDLWLRHKLRGSQPSLSELVAALDKVIQDFKQKIFVVLDALDECPQSERTHLLDFISHFAQSKFENLCILATSRAEPDIRDAMRKATPRYMDIGQRMKSDITKHVRIALSNQTLARWGPRAVSLMENELLLSDETRFRWADLQIRRLLLCTTEDRIWSALKTVPRTLEETYAAALERIEEDDRESVQKILMWLAFSARELTLNEVAAVAGFRFSEDVLRICTSLLVTIIDTYSGEVVKLGHFSVKEFLVCRHLEDKALEWFNFSGHLANAKIASMSLSALLGRDQWATVQGESSRFGKHLSKYAAEFWPSHVRETDDSPDMMEIQSQINLLFTSSADGPYQQWLGIHDPETRYNRTFEKTSRTAKDFPQPLYTAALLGLRATVEHLFRDGTQLSKSEGRFRNALGAAAVSGSLDVVKFLMPHYDFTTEILNISHVFRELRENIRPVLAVFLDAEAGLILNKTVFEATMDNVAREEILDVLLRRLETMLDRNELRVESMTTLLETAAGYTNLKFPNGLVPLLNLILNHWSSNVSVPEMVVKAAALSYSFGNNSIEHLLKRKASSIHISEDILRAFRGKYELDSIWELILTPNGPSISFTDAVFQAALENSNGERLLAIVPATEDARIAVTEVTLQLAIQKGELMLLIKYRRKLRLSMSEDFLISALGAAGEEEGLEMIEWLTEKSDSEVRISKSILASAVQNDRINEKTMRRLLDRCGPAVPFTEEMLYSPPRPLFFEKERAFESARRRLFHDDKKIRWLLGQKEWSGSVTESLLKIAASIASPQVMQILLDRSDPPSRITEEVLQAAVDPLNPPMVKLLLRQPKLDAKTVPEMLFVQVLGDFDGDPELVQLLAKNFRPRARNSQLIIAKAAATSGVEANLVALRENCDTEALPPQILSIFHLHRAARTGDTTLASDALATGVDPDIKDILGRSPLAKTCISSHAAIARQLLASPRVDVNLRDNKGRTPIFYAVQLGSLELTELLLQAGADLDIEDDDGDTPLSIAAFDSWREISLLGRLQKHRAKINNEPAFADFF
ncbi:uncharacterized protein PV07_07701 [Cladophialophora immunda]|uniref:NACHT domain-containing protein n=1 Tax=Cladophialophora immunda TaxID=569365 RepID=A0A0D2CWP1_9EURO|nr:uncharacterized protein PV07_07701 [Cladophialophora immunda]KIW28009.1 hypothetical protein PV07_07701 [Cladophialophora immunda]